MFEHDDLRLHEMEKPYTTPLQHTNGGKGWLIPIIPIPLTLLVLLFMWVACADNPTEPVGQTTEQIDHNEDQRPPSEGVDTLGDTVCAD